MVTFKKYLALFFTIALVWGNQEAFSYPEDSCQTVKSAIKRARANLIINENLFSKTSVAKKKTRQILKRIKNLKAAKLAMGCSSSGAGMISEPTPVGEACVQMIVCRMVGGEVVEWPNPCVAADEMPDYESLPHC